MTEIVKAIETGSNNITIPCSKQEDFASSNGNRISLNYYTFKKDSDATCFIKRHISSKKISKTIMFVLKDKYTPFKMKIINLLDVPEILFSIEENNIFYIITFFNLHGSHKKDLINIDSEFFLE